LITRNHWLTRHSLVVSVV